MSDAIARGNDGRLRCWFESTPGFPASDLARKKLGADNVREAPTEVLDRDWLVGDSIVAFRSNGPLAKRIASAVGTTLPRLGAGAYRIECLKSRRDKTLVIVGGDLFGMLAGMAEAFLWGEVTRDGFLYRGGSRSEKPSFPLRYYWTTDTSTNWVLDDPGNQFQGCTLRYTKKPETFVEDYRRLVDHCIEMRFNGVLIWGFLRDCHGGATAAYEVAKYASDRGVVLMPGIGTTAYGGPYIEGNHPCNIETYLSRNRELAKRSRDGRYEDVGMSPYHPPTVEWIARGVEWIYRSFPIGGCNLENGDYLVDESPRAKRIRARIKTGEKDYFKDQYYGYKMALDVAHRLKPDGWNVYATYAGFGRSKDKAAAFEDMGAEPYFARHMPRSAIAQWTLSGMVSEKIIPLREWMSSPRPAGIYTNPFWPKGLRPPTPRSAGFLHQASQWFMPTRRTDVAMSSLAEACLRCWEEGLEGISVHGEVSSRQMAWKLNYLTMRHWTYHPESTLEEFALAEIAPRVGGEKEARTFVEVLSRIEEGKTGLEVEKLINQCAGPWAPSRMGTPQPRDFERHSMWMPLKEWNCCRDAPARYPYRPISLGGGVA